MQIIDFAHSFLTFRIDTLKKPPTTVSHKPPYSLNNARIPLDSRCVIVEKEGGGTMEFVQGVSCKTEQVGVEKDIWLRPNADFVPVLSEDQYLFIKTYHRAGEQIMLYPPSRGPQPDRMTGLVSDAFDNLRIDLAHGDGKVLEKNEEIVEAVLKNRILIGRTEIESDRYRALIEYPMKTINANERDNIYQPDTGPILFPDLSRNPDELIAGFELAFIAYNTGDWAEFVVRAPTDITEDIAVYHYSRSVRVDTKNTILLLEEKR